MDEGAGNVRERKKPNTGDEEHGTNLSQHPREQAEHEATQVEEEQGYLEGLPRTTPSREANGCLPTNERRQRGVSWMTTPNPIKADKY